MRIVIIGAGIGGCAAALALHARGIEVTVYEAAREVLPLGVGINVLPHAMAVLDELSLAERVESLGVPTGELAFFNRHGQLIWREPRGRAAGYPVPQVSVHRGRLQLALLDAVRERLGPSSVRTGHALESVECGEPGPAVALLRDRQSDSLVRDAADAVIAADGIHSTVRAAWHPDQGSPKWSGNLLWRGVTRAPSFLTGASMFMSGHRPHKFVAYPITMPDADGMQLVNWIAELDRTAEGLRSREDWNRVVDASEFADRFTTWRFDWLDIPSLIAGADAVYEFPMVDRDPLERWTEGRVTLLGDAAHPMYPIGSNGASQAVLDATCLARCLSSISGSSGVPNALRAYESERLPATARIVLSNRQHGPERVLDMAEERAPAGFVSVRDVFADGELEEISAQYKQVAGFARPS